VHPIKLLNYGGRGNDMRVIELESFEELLTDNLVLRLLTGMSTPRSKFKLTNPLLT
jgi:hypothetical protein